MLEMLVTLIKRTKTTTMPILPLLIRNLMKFYLSHQHFVIILEQVIQNINRRHLIFHVEGCDKRNVKLGPCLQRI